MSTTLRSQRDDRKYSRDIVPHRKSETRRDIPEKSARYFLDREKKFQGTVFDHGSSSLNHLTSSPVSSCLHQLRQQFRHRLNELGITDNDPVIRDAAKLRLIQMKTQTHPHSRR